MNFKNLTDRKLAYSLEILADSVEHGSNWDKEKRQTAALHMHAISNTLLARSQKPEARSQKPEARSQKPEARSQIIMMDSFITI